ncbi:MAG: YggS family pyridoxal phosphate-dependent enzyme [Clostridia bacterium]|nr:YggS family pyridoxal phosphate-dependent enzyme [Clostridia bacterium]
MEFSIIQNNINKIFRCLEGSDTQLIAVTKTRTSEEINAAIACGVRHIGENRVQELLEKYDHIQRENVSIHLIGRLQTNKVKYIIDKVDLIHSVDSYRLAAEISKRASAINKVQDILVEINIGGEESKGGILPDELCDFLKNISSLPSLRIRGLMAIPPIQIEPHQNYEYFLKMRQLLVDISNKKLDNINMDILSMGMSDDYEDAIKAGSSFIRVGRGIFGQRNSTEVK